MGFLDHVSCVLLFLVGIILMLEVHHSVDAQQTFNLHNFPLLSLESSWGGSTRLLWPERIRFKANPTAPAFSFSTRFEAFLSLGGPSTRQAGYGSKNNTINQLKGFTFAIIPEKLNASFGGDGGYLGLLNATSDGDPKARIVAVEFDFVNNPEFSDPDGEDGGYHIGININSMNSTAWAPMTRPVFPREDFAQLDVWIDYDSSVGTLNVTIADSEANLGCPLSGNKPPSPAKCDTDVSENITCNFLSLNVDLSSVLNEHMYVGFTFSESQHGSYSRMDMIAWSLRTTPSGPSVLSASLPCSNRRNNLMVVFKIHRGESLLLIVVPALAIIWNFLFGCYARRRWLERQGWRFQIDPDGLPALEVHKFTYKELSQATMKFASKLLLGRGGFGSVYKGFLPGNREFVAVKRVATESNQGEREFMAEVTTIGKIRHRNLVRLQGWCHERGELLLVYDLMPNGSLDKLLFGPHNAPSPDSQPQQDDAESLDSADLVKFPWERRYKAVIDVARALVYLHTECEERIIHRDVKAANVMFDAKFNARLGDFGLARSYNHSLLAPDSTNVAGTFGYLAPELYYTGKQTERTDVFSYGTFLLEVACGKKPIYHENGGETMMLVDHVWKMWGDSNILSVADPNLRGVYSIIELNMVLCLGLLCSHPNPVMRPSMKQVLLIFNGDAPLPQVPLTKPSGGYDFERSFSLGSSSPTNPTL